MDIFKLVGSVFIDTTDSDKALQKTGETAEKTGSKFGNMAKTAGKVALGVGAAVGAGATAMMGMAKESAKATDEIDKMSQRLGLSRESYQELDFVLSQNGVEINSFQTGMKSLLKNMDAVTEGNKTAIANFEKLGVSVQNADGSMRTQEEVLFDTITAFQGMTESAEKSRLAQELFGKQGQEILPMLNDQKGGLEELRKQAHELGLVLSDETIDAGVEFTDTLDQVQRSFSAVVTEIGVAVMPILMELLNWILAHMPEIKATIGAVFEFIQAMIPVVMEVVKTIEPIVSELFKHIKTLWETVLKPVLNAVISLLKGDFKGAFSSVFEAIGNVVRGVFSGMISAVKGPLNTIIGLVNSFINGVNRLKIPDWVPGVGGRGVNIPNVPYLAKGGSVIGGGSAIVGEAGAELIEMPQGARVTPLNDNNNAFAKMERQLELLQQGMNNLASAMYGYRPQIVLDTGVLVGEIAPGMDEELGNIAQMKERGV